MILIFCREPTSFYLVILFLFFGSASLAQPCSSPITTFPYNEGFENSKGNWFDGGTVSDWAWGNVSKPVITGSASGNSCWVTGGLNNSFYNNSENSWLQSPCFDFTSLQYPQISFRIFWETERKFDGASLQYTTDNGSNWSFLGSINSNTNCEGENWFNTPSITYLSGANGWSGNIQANSGSCLGGSGSAGWLTAKHTLSFLAGKTNVRFRFLFGSGSTCNAYDGFAIDDVQIAEAPVNMASINTSCRNDSTIAFEAVASCAISYAWDFNDLASGSGNSSVLKNPSHIFSAPGTYNVTLITQFVSGPPVVSNKEIVNLGLTTNNNWPGRCTGAPNATLTVTVTGGNGSYFYNWNTMPPQSTPTISNVGPGNYIIAVSSNNACVASASISLAASTPFNITAIIKDEICSAKNGSITSIVAGGTAPYQYEWSNGLNTASAQNLSAGNYSLQVTGSNGCKASPFSVKLQNVIKSLPVNLGPDQRICTGQQVILNAGTYKSYRWQDNSSLQTITANTAGNYFVTVTDSAGCTGSDTVNIVLDCSGIYFPTAFTPNNDGRNDGFGPLGNLSGLKNYQLSVFNRYGEPIFSSSNSLSKWNGSVKGGQPKTGSFIWMASFVLNGKREFRKGNVLLVR